MKRSRIIVLVIALAAGGIAAMLASGNRTPEAPKPPEPPPPLATVDVLVAKTDLGTGQVVAEGDVGPFCRMACAQSRWTYRRIPAPAVSSCRTITSTSY
jgi:Flp pilus assembly protein CpaB